MPDEPDDKTVKELIDAATRAELERWFGLPSFQQVEERAEEPAPDDPDIVAVRERREQALAAVDPAMVERHRVRFESPEKILKFKQEIELRIDPSVALLDHSMIERQASIAEPRDVEISEDLRDDLKDCTPQAILRDLHRPELEFEKIFEITDYGAENRVDVVGIVHEVMGTEYRFTEIQRSPFGEGREILRELRKTRRESIADVLPSLPNRRVTG